MMVATTAPAMLQLGVLAPDQGRVLTARNPGGTGPLQLGSCVLGFLAQNPVAGTGWASLPAPGPLSVWRS